LVDDGVKIIDKVDSIVLVVDNVFWGVVVSEEIKLVVCVGEVETDKLGFNIELVIVGVSDNVELPVILFKDEEVGNIELLVVKVPIFDKEYDNDSDTDGDDDEDGDGICDGDDNGDADEERDGDDDDKTVDVLLKDNSGVFEYVCLLLTDDDWVRDANGELDKVKSLPLVIDPLGVFVFVESNEDVIVWGGVILIEGVIDNTLLKLWTPDGELLWKVVWVLDGCGVGVFVNIVVDVILSTADNDVDADEDIDIIDVCVKVSKLVEVIVLVIEGTIVFDGFSVGDNCDENVYNVDLDGFDEKLGVIIAEFDNVKIEDIEGFIDDEIDIVFDILVVLELVEVNEPLVVVVVVLELVVVNELVVDWEGDLELVLDLVIFDDKVDVLVAVLLEVCETDIVDVFEFVELSEKNPEIDGFALAVSEGQAVIELVIVIDEVIEGEGDKVPVKDALLEIVSELESVYVIVLIIVLLGVFVCDFLVL